MAKQEKVIQLDDDFDLLADLVNLPESARKKPKEEKPKNKILAKLESLPIFKKLKRFYERSIKRNIKRFPWIFRGILAILAFIVFVIIIAIVSSIYTPKDDYTPNIEAIAPPQFRIQTGGDLITDAENLEEWIAKANFLYATGSREEAMDLFGRISNYSEGLSNYNLGVAQMTDGSLEDALVSFQKAIDIGEDRVMSALNAAVCALLLDRVEQFDYYVNLAEAYLPYAGNLPLYSHLYALTQFYRGNYIEALSPLVHSSADFYVENENYLKASLFAYFGDDAKAVEALLQNSNDPDNWVNIALLYARIGEYDSADEYLSQSLARTGANFADEIALELIRIKRARWASVAQIISKYAKDQENIDNNPYPIKISLREKFFDVNIAQRRFWRDFEQGKLNSYKIIFYFAPYQVFDAREAFEIISEGGLRINTDNVKEAKETLLRGQTISRVNRNIARGIKEALAGNIRLANDILKEAVKSYPNHAILHYNLGLNHAQLSDFDSAYTHFLRAFHLNPKDVLSGIFALICAQATHRDIERLNADVGREITEFNGDIYERRFVLNLLNFARDGIVNTTDLAESKPSIAMYAALDYAQSVVVKDQEKMIQNAQTLVDLYPRDPISNLLHILAVNFNDDPKLLSLKMQHFYQSKNISKEQIYYGPAIAREMYISIAHIVGTLHYVRDDLEFKMISEQNDVRGIASALALCYLYLQEFEKSYTLYSSLIDDFKQNDSESLFLGAVAAVGAGHTENAAVLLQLSKTESPTNYEARIGAGILYQQEKNFHAAAIQFSQLGIYNRESDYFDFVINTNDILGQSRDEGNGAQ